MSDTVEVIPSPRRIISSLMNLGHDFITAVADIVDNAIEAGATEVSIKMEFDGENSTVSIADNGKGMTPEVLDEAMRFGSERDYGANDLGKFGLGLKTASLSQCRKFTVASRPEDGNADIYSLTWDMDQLEENNRWEVMRVPVNKLKKNISDPLRNDYRTVVFWHQIVLCLGYKNPGGEPAKKHFYTILRNLEEHLAMVFHRFMSGEDEHQPVEIRLDGKEIQPWDPFARDGKEIQPWDPFARDEKETRRLETATFEIKEDGVEGEVIWEPFVLPPQKKFSSDAAHKYATGPNKWNDQQGFYIYRANRMIQSGGWCGIRTKDEHSKLARIALRFPPSLDKAFKIDLAKMSVQLPPTITKQIESHLPHVIKIAQDVYRSKPTDRPDPVPPDKPSHPNGGLKDDPDDSAPDDPPPPPPPIPKKKWTFDEIATLLRQEAFSNERPILDAVIKRARKQARQDNEL